MEDWASIAAEVAEALGEFSEITLHQPGVPGETDPMTEIVIGGAEPQDHAGSGFEDQYSAYSIASGVVEAKDVRFFAAALKRNGEPMPKPVPDAWTATVNGVTYTIVGVGATQPAGLPVMYELQLRAN